MPRSRGTWSREQAAAAGKRGQETQRRRQELTRLIRDQVRDLASSFPLELSTRLRANLVQLSSLIEQESARGLKADATRMRELARAVTELKQAEALPLETRNGRSSSTPTAAPPPITIPTPAPQPGPSPATPSTPSPIESAPID